MMIFSVYCILVTLSLNVASKTPYNPSAYYKNHFYLPRCKYDDFKHDKEIHKAEFVFTGKVSNADVVYKENEIVFSVVVRRYFKNLFKIPKTREVRVVKTLIEGEGVKCRIPIRPKFTAIFIGKKFRDSEEADIVLSVGPIPVTLYNLDRVSAATKG